MDRDLWRNVMQTFAMISISTAKDFDLTPEEQHDRIVYAAEEIINTIMVCCDNSNAYEPSLN